MAKANKKKSKKEVEAIYRQVADLVDGCEAKQIFKIFGPIMAGMIANAPSGVGIAMMLAFTKSVMECAYGGKVEIMSADDLYDPSEPLQ